MVSTCLCQAVVRRTNLPCLRKTKAGSDFCGYHHPPPPPPEDDCTICMCPMKKNRDTVTTPCKHIFHKACLNQWTSRGNHSCPLCRASLPNGLRIKEYNIIFSVDGEMIVTNTTTGIAFLL